MGAPIWLQILVFALVAGSLIGGLRPVLHRKLLHITQSKLDSSTRGLEGAEATVIEQVSPSKGMIRVEGDLWSARSAFDHEHFSPGARVIITRIDSARAYVTAAIERTPHGSQ